eukprot:m.81063 g.81063  ORF g.81063 m.81063 type:complete len:195 (-) comp8216_c0_seq1:29-613(-)
MLLQGQPQQQQRPQQPQSPQPTRVASVPLSAAYNMLPQLRGSTESPPPSPATSSPPRQRAQQPLHLRAPQRAPQSSSQLASQQQPLRAPSDQLWRSSSLEFTGFNSLSAKQPHGFSFGPEHENYPLLSTAAAAYCNISSSNGNGSSNCNSNSNNINNNNNNANLHTLTEMLRKVNASTSAPTPQQRPALVPLER